MSLNEHLAEAPDHRRKVREGMIVRSKEALEPGLSIFKLGHRFDRKRRQNDEQVISSPWWFTEATVESITRAAQNANENLADVFRRFGAVAKRWGGSGDLIVKARIGAPVIAYIGPGVIKDFRGDEDKESDNTWDMPLWVPSPNIAQLYIPFTPVKDPSSSIASAALRDVYIVPIDKWDESYIRGNPNPKWRLW
ncbi:hypothetical protein [Paraburkholderia caffeinitolerans]|nr:hypothetical protein [Paraburkholderia caffeinitolerans]